MRSDDRRRILLCDGDEELQSIVRDFFEQKSCDVIVTKDANDAWARICAEAPDAVITDNDLEGMSGLDLLALIFASGIELPVIFMTNAGSERVAAEALNLGASGYVFKDRPEELVLTLNRSLSRTLHENDLKRENKLLVQRLRRQNDELERLVTERTEDLRKAFDALKSLDKLKSDFMTLVSHEMRTPLTTILGFSEILTQGLYEDKEELHGIHEHLLDASTRLSEFVNESIELFQWIAGKRRISLDTFPLDSLARLSIDALAGFARDKDVRIEGDLPLGLLVEGDMIELQAAVQRVLDNAIKYSNPGGTVEVRIDHVDGSRRYELVIVDQGLGIDPERVRGLFSPMEVCGDINHHQEGQGLGLPLAQEAIRAHGGEITVKSAGIGHGTSVRILLHERVPEKYRIQATAEFHPLLGKSFVDA